ncbi:hypothetical protein GGQ22_05530 [Nocardioides sp. zg-579]|uniref:Uncharacterized protein n=1 Tax=Nocardioides marmotae TaxID=2663857 RepID=A0A6I3J9V8_9ACTN|nr:hypothetical protein [Nocardioides marmotae]MCR6030901.1 hypothetical protein [Gordonia jinghuaiqii]MTB94538.1 hypothetical protein [Nocardioides marmotae]QKE01447.1 hypothetical protein HPC71_10455 [Nocardioides marmotae]
MDHRRTLSVPAWPRLPWAVFAAAALLVLAGCVVAALRTGDPARAGVVLAGGVIAVGIAALFLVGLVAPLPDRTGGGRPRGHWHGGHGDGGAASGGSADGGGGSGGDC